MAALAPVLALLVGPLPLGSEPLDLLWLIEVLRIVGVVHPVDVFVRVDDLLHHPVVDGLVRLGLSGIDSLFLHQALHSEEVV